MRVINLVAIGALALVGQAQAADLTVELSGIKSAEGVVRVQVFSEAAAFPDGKPDQEQLLPANTAGVSATFTGLAAGEYAVAAYQDANENGKLDANFMGMPTEDVGNSGETALAKPGFEKSKFAVGEDNLTIKFVLR